MGDKVIAIYGVFLTAATVILLFFGFPVIVQIYKNSILNETVEPQDIRWKLVEIKDEEYRPEAHYSYVVNGKTYEKEELFQGESFRNPYKGQDALKTLSGSYPVVWYLSYDPSYATLEKYFPTKRAIYCGIVFVILIYTVWGLNMYFRYLDKINPPKG